MYARKVCVEVLRARDRELPPAEGRRVDPDKPKLCRDRNGLGQTPCDLAKVSLPPRRRGRGAAPGPRCSFRCGYRSEHSLFVAHHKGSEFDAR